MRMMSESPGSVMESDDTRKYLPHAVPKSTLSAHTRTQVHHQSQTAVIDQPIDWAVSVWPGSAHAIMRTMSATIRPHNTHA